MATEETGSQPGQNWNPTLGETDLTSVKNTLGQVEQLLPFLIGLGPVKRRRLAKVGDRTRPFVADTVTTALANPGIVPRSVDLVALKARADTVDHLGEVQRALAQLLEKVADTRTQLASDLYGITRSVYSVMKTSVAEPGLAERKRQLGARFASQGRRRQSEETVRK